MKQKEDKANVVQIPKRYARNVKKNISKLQGGEKGEHSGE